MIFQKTRCQQNPGRQEAENLLEGKKKDSGGKEETQEEDDSPKNVKIFLEFFFEKFSEKLLSFLVSVNCWLVENSNKTSFFIENLTSRGLCHLTVRYYHF